MKEKRSGKGKSKQDERILESLPKELRKQFELISKETSVSMPSSMKLYLKNYRLLNSDGELKKANKVLLNQLSILLQTSSPRVC
ncbi:MAG: hypothetical protein QW279_08005 [Candidatus Jordarchaeaceae archaeon]